MHLHCILRQIVDLLWKKKKKTFNLRLRSFHYLKYFPFFQSFSCSYVWSTLHNSQFPKSQWLTEVICWIRTGPSMWNCRTSWQSRFSLKHSWTLKSRKSLKLNSLLTGVLVNNVYGTQNGIGAYSVPENEVSVAGTLCLSPHRQWEIPFENSLYIPMLPVSPLTFL